MFVGFSTGSMAFAEVELSHANTVKPSIHRQNIVRMGTSNCRCKVSTGVVLYRVTNSTLFQVFLLTIAKSIQKMCESMESVAIVASDVRGFNFSPS